MSSRAARGICISRQTTAYSRRYRHSARISKATPKCDQMVGLFRSFRGLCPISRPRNLLRTAACHRHQPRRRTSALRRPWPLCAAGYQHSGSPRLRGDPGYGLETAGDPASRARWAIDFRLLCLGRLEEYRGSEFRSLQQNALGIFTNMFGRRVSLYHSGVGRVRGTRFDFR